MAHQPPPRSIKPVRVEKFDVSDDGEIVMLAVQDKAGNEVWIGFDWRHVSTVLSVTQMASKRAKDRRVQLGKTDAINDEPQHSPFLIVDFEGRMTVHGEMRVMALHAVNGLRFDMAISPDVTRPDGTPLPVAIGQFLIGPNGKRRPRIQ